MRPCLVPFADNVEHGDEKVLPNAKPGEQDWAADTQLSPAAKSKSQQKKSSETEKNSADKSKRPTELGARKQMAFPLSAKERIVDGANKDEEAHPAVGDHASDRGEQPNPTDANGQEPVNKNDDVRSSFAIPELDALQGENSKYLDDIFNSEDDPAITPS
ncbi:hypothetical protein OSTOST_07370 [Ostertagia ostertagi]